MKDAHPNLAISKLPFGLTVKPVPHYFYQGLVRFNMREGIMYYTIKMITKTTNVALKSGQVMNKNHLDLLLGMKSLDEIQTIEVVN